MGPNDATESNGEVPAQLRAKNPNAVRSGHATSTASIHVKGLLIEDDHLSRKIS